MRVASFHGYGIEPESQAFAKLEVWVREQGPMEEIEQHRVFGFNNPNPSEGTPHYGYKVWITIDEDVEAEGDMEIKQVSGGRYAVMVCKPVTGEEIPQCWQQLVNWLANSQHRHANHQWLEEHIWPTGAPFGDTSEGQLTLRLFAPIGS
ncbi:MAG: effector binding domain-containing protein [Armatimonadota bacterium]